MKSQSHITGRIIRLPEVMERTGIKRSSIYTQIKEGTFPEQINLGARSVGWLESEIDAWVCDQVSKARGK